MEGAQGNAQPMRPLKSALKRSNSAVRLRPDGGDPMELLEVLVHKDSFVSTPTLCTTLSLDLTWTAPSSSSQEAPQTQSRGVQVQDGRRNVCEFPPGASPIIRLVTRQTRQRPTHTLQELSFASSPPYERNVVRVWVNETEVVVCNEITECCLRSVRL